MDKPVVIVKQGPLRGATVENIPGKSFIAFKGIPYAAPPVGNLRFADPQPPQPWTGIRDALEAGSQCAQVDFATNTIVGSDDCLYLDVATTSLTESRPVMVWIHGGGFIFGHGDLDFYGPDYMMGSEIVYVGINYRLGVLGFLDLNHEAVPGNMGLKDQVAALKWVKENIAQFGGDPNNVTIFGESAGGASVHYLLISPLAKGLFHKAISQSGVVLNPWAAQSEPVDTARRYVAALRKDITDPNEIVEYLRTIPVQKLIEVQHEVLPMESKIQMILPFGPSIDNKSVEPFMPRSRKELVAEGFDIRGGFIFGHGDLDFYGPDYMMGSEIVYVGINYRLGVLGFLDLNHEAVPGNMGLKDQVAALKWVKENIAQFGGDPNNVTIFGESAGGASVHYLLISPLAKGLFHKAISQSGVVLNPWAAQSEPVDTARRYVAALRKDITDPNEIVEYLRTIPVQKLIEVQHEVLPMESKIQMILPFGPSIDNKSVEPFMPRSRKELVAEGFDIPVIIGYNSHEGLFLLETGEDSYKKLDENFEAIVPRDLAVEAPSKVPEIAKEIRKLYFGERRITKDLVDEYVQCCGDLNFGLGIHKVVEIQRKKKSPTYFYRFSYNSPKPPTTPVLQVSTKGTAHADELQYIFTGVQFDIPIQIEPGSTENTLRDRLIRMWTDFAKTGNPTPSIDNLITEKWEPVTPTSKNYMEISAELSNEVNLGEDMWETWNRIYAMIPDQ